MKRKLAMMLACMLVAVTAMAQSVISGTVVSAQDGEPVIGATVKVKGASKGTVTDMNGKFKIETQAGKTLVFSYIGMQSKEAAAKNGMSVSLGADDTQLDEVVVTAMGISRSEKSLGYSATTLKADELTSVHTANVADALSGKVAGVQVSATSSDPGAASNIIIRGFSSINGSNQPLYVVDGVPMQQTTLSGMGKNIAAGGVGNISSNDIASMTILKGAAATALYGSRAANGVVLITTKEGKGGDRGRNFSIEYNGSLQARRVSTLPDFQNDFGQGWDGAQTYIENGSWGPKFDGSYQLYGPIYDGQELYGKYESQNNNVRDFFDTGISQSHSVALSGISSDKKMTYYLSYAFNGDDGIMPTDADSYKRNTIAFRGSYEATKWLKISSSLNFARSNTDAVSTYQGSSVIDGLFELPRNISIVDMKDTSSPFNTPNAYLTPYGITNPYWAIENNYNHTDAKQVYGKIQLDIKPIQDLTLTYRMGFDYTDYDRKIGYPEISVETSKMWNDRGYSTTNMNQSGYVYASYGRKYETNHDFLAAYKHTFLEKLDVNVTAGLNVNERYATSLANEADELAIATGFWQLSNGSSWTTMSESQSKRRLVGLFGDVTFGWDNMIYLDLTARNDWSSTLPKSNNSYFYPGATLSWIFTNVIPENNILSYGKLRVAYGKTGNDASPYLTTDSYVQGYANGYYGSSIASFPMNGTNAFQKGSTAGNENLKPEMTTETEFGADLQFFKGRVGINFSYYNRKTKDQIFTLPVDPSTGYSYKVVNFGTVRNRGIELALNFVPIQTKNFRWDLGFNYAKNNNKVLSLPAELDGGKTIIYSFSAGNDAVYMYAEEGKALGEFYTYLPTYWDGKSVNEDGSLVYNYEGVGHPVVGDDGQVLLSSEVKDTGKSINSDWTGGVTTSFTYKNLSLSAALDIRKGGYMFSRSKNIMQFTGNGIGTTYNSRDPFIIPNSVYEDGSENLTPLSMTDDGIQTYYDQGGVEGGNGLYMIDRSFVKLRNISLTYSLPKKWLAPITLSEVTVGIFCNNVFTWTAKGNRYIDPENTTVSQSSYGDLAAQFGETYVNPSCRTFGFNLGVKF